MMADRTGPENHDARIENPEAEIIDQDRTTEIEI